MLKDEVKGGEVNGYRGIVLGPHGAHGTGFLQAKCAFCHQVYIDKAL